MVDYDADAETTKLPAGRYIIGDPCYHIPGDQWPDVIYQAGAFADRTWSNFTTFDGRQGTVVAFQTFEGDGLYKDLVGREFPVDSGLIGIIPFGDIDPRELDLKSAHVIEFTAPFTCRETNEGTLIFGYIEINTADETSDDLNDGDDDPLHYLDGGDIDEA
jgi:hypothetical protein